MALQVRRRENENPQSLVRRFSQRVQRSGILNRAKKNRFFKSPESQERKKRAALRREQLKKEFEKRRKFAKPE